MSEHNEIADFIFDYINRPQYHVIPMTELYDIISNEFSVSYTEYYQIIYDMESRKQLFISKKNKVCAYKNQDGYTGTFRANAKGFGFVTPDEQFIKFTHGDVYISPENTLNAIDGDTVRMTVDQNYFSDQGPSGHITEIIEHNLKTLIGTVKKYQKFSGNRESAYKVIPDDRHLCFTVIIDEPDANSNMHYDSGNRVEVEITRYPERESYDANNAHGKVIAVFGDSDTIEANYNAILHSANIKTQFDSDTLAEAEHIDSKTSNSLKNDGRLDLRGKIVFTIDGADAKDLDDAISIERNPYAPGYILGVHIADVSEYVRPGTALDREAFERGTSIYFADKVIPMLPEPISNGVCSLNPNADRLTLSAFVEINENGDIDGCTLYESIISTSVRGVYTELNDVVANGRNSQFYEKYAVLYGEDKIMDTMLELYNILEKKSRKRGALELETAEAKIIINKDGTVDDIVKSERGITERLIEQFMLAANEAVANWLFWQDLPCVYRIHEEPSPEKIRTFTTFAHNLGLNISPLRTKNVHSAALQNVLEQAQEDNYGTIVSYVLLRSLMKARYSAVPSQHFGLAIEKYCHFTSPIRRYPDLTVHRIVKMVLRGELADEKLDAMSDFAELSAKNSSDTELKATQAERDIDDLYKASFMKDKIGQPFDGVISSVTQFGFFVELENTCEGLVHVNTLDGYFEFDERTMTLSCGRRVFMLGKKVKVIIENVSLSTGKIDMVLKR